MAEEDKVLKTDHRQNNHVKDRKRFGEVGDVIFETSGELIHMVLNPTNYCEKLELEKDKEGNLLVPQPSSQSETWSSLKKISSRSFFLSLGFLICFKSMPA